MKRVLLLSRRNIIETLKDYVSLIFIVGLPIIMLVLMQILFGDIPEASMFEITNYAPGICVFGYAFCMLYIGVNMAQDKESAFMLRISVSPVTKKEYLLSYILYSFPIMLCQTILFYIVSLFFGLTLDGKFFLSIIMLIPSMIFFSSCGVFLGTIAKSEKQVGPISSMLVTGVGIMGGVFMPIETISGGFLTVCKILPFYNGVNLAKCAFSSLSVDNFINFLVIFGWSILLFIISLLVFVKKNKK
ncbi:MAG: ABC transporter permease [Firmicutes bacterium]|nr:ABC transporter permease [Candidatus Caballimonas caccae]